jgi:D-3-phosphoglycerate dehydrogenase
VQSLRQVEVTTEYHQIDSPQVDLTPLLRERTVVVTESVHIRRSLLEQLPQLRLVVRAGIGVDIIDVADARVRGVLVANVPQFCVEEVADHTLLLILSLVRKLDPYLNDVRQGIWHAPLRAGVRRMSRLQVGVVGLGSIGTQVVHRLRGFGCTPLVHDPQARQAPEGTILTSLDEVIRSSDIITLHCPLTEATRGLITAARLRENARCPVVINVSRGELLDLEGLHGLLEDGQVRGLGLDVLPGEPWPDLEQPVVRHPHALVTPHVAWWSEDAVAELNESIFTTISQFVQTGEVPANVEVGLAPH